VVLSGQQAKVFETPNASMRTLAAPSRGARELAVWQVQMAAGQRGPQHSADREQVWVVLDGRAEATVGGRIEVAAAGDAIVFAAGEPRQVSAPEGLVALVASGGAANVTSAQGAQPLPWAA
jgi:quercetin dioxygenase-like cupin family protein